MGSYERKLRRKKTTKAKKQAEKDMTTKIALFGKLGNECLTCKRAFDKTSREQVMNWTVIVRQEKEEVNLYCPECWKMAINFIKEIKDEKE